MMDELFSMRGLAIKTTHRFRIHRWSHSGMHSPLAAALRTEPSFVRKPAARRMAHHFSHGAEEKGLARKLQFHCGSGHGNGT